jgi:hypothetical protein
MKEPDQFNRIFVPGAFWGILGLPRAGKTTVLLMIAQAALEHGWVVISNVKLHKWDTARERNFEATVPGYHYVRTWAQLWGLLPQYVGMTYDKTKITHRYSTKTKIMLCIDEAMLTDLGGGRTLQSSKPRSAISMAAQAGKLGISIVIVAHSTKMLTSQMRVGGLLTGYVRKIGKPPFSAQEMARFEVPDPDVINFDPDNLSHYRMVWLRVQLDETVGIARSQEMLALPEGGYDSTQVVFISETPASVVTGTYPAPHEDKPFDMDHMLETLSEVEPEEMAVAIAKELAYPPHGAKKPAKDDGPEPAPEHSGVEKTGEIKNAIVALLKNGLTPAQVIERVGKERRSQVYEYQRQIKLGLI